MTDRSTVVDDVRAILGETLALGNRTDGLSANSRLLGYVPEFDSMAVVSVLVALEEHFDIVVQDDEVSADTFETVESLTSFVIEKLDS